MYRTILAVTGVVLLTVAAAPAPVAGTTPSPPAADDGRLDPDKVICRTVRPPTGTRVANGRTRQKICQTREQWEDLERDAQEALKVRDRGICTGDNCSGA